MKLWLLRPVRDLPKENPWEPWYDKAFGFVVRAETAEKARELVASANYSNSEYCVGDEGTEPWRNYSQTTCEELTTEGDPSIIMRDFAAA